MIVELSALQSAKKFFAGSNNFANDINESQNMINLIDAFISSDNVSGDAWQAVKGNLNTYTTALTARVNLATRLGDTIRDILDDLIKFLTTDDGNGTYNALDLSKMGEIANEIKKMDRNIEALKVYKSTLFKYVDIKNSKGEVVNQKKLIDFEGRASVQEDIDDLEEVLEQFTKLYVKMSDFEELYNTEIGKLESISKEITEFETAYESLVPGESVTLVDYSY